MFIVHYVTLLRAWQPHFTSYLLPLQDRIIERLKQLAGPLIDLPPREETVRKFSNHCRLWVGNLPLDIKEDDVKELFKPFGEYDEVYFDKNKGFAFVRMVSRECPAKLLGILLK